jgi:hypothetical protein
VEKVVAAKALCLPSCHQDFFIMQPCQFTFFVSLIGRELSPSYGGKPLFYP